MFMTIPTLMTWTRIVAIPLIIGVFYLQIEHTNDQRNRDNTGPSHQGGNGHKHRVIVARRLKRLTFINPVLYH